MDCYIIIFLLQLHKHFPTHLRLYIKFSNRWENFYIMEEYDYPSAGLEQEGCIELFPKENPLSFDWYMILSKSYLMYHLNPPFLDLKQICLSTNK